MLLLPHTVSVCPVYCCCRTLSLFAQRVAVTTHCLSLPACWCYGTLSLFVQRVVVMAHCLCLPSVLLLPHTVCLPSVLLLPHTVSVCQCVVTAHCLCHLYADYIHDRLYWADAKIHKISSADLNGLGLRVVLQQHRFLSHPFAITVFEVLSK